MRVVKEHGAYFRTGLLVLALAIYLDVYLHYRSQIVETPWYPLFFLLAYLIFRLFGWVEESRQSEKNS